MTNRYTLNDSNTIGKEKYFKALSEVNSNVSDPNYLRNNQELGYRATSYANSNDTSSLFGTASDFLFGKNEKYGFSERFEATNPFTNFPDVWRTFHQKRVQAELTRKEEELRELNEKLKSLDLIDGYADLLQWRKEAKESLDTAKKTDPQKAANLEEWIRELDESIQKRQEYFKTYGKKDDDYRQLFFNHPENRSDSGNFFNALWENTFNSAGNAGNALSQIMQFGANVWNLGEDAIGAVGDFATGGDANMQGRYNYYDRAIKSSSPDDRSFDGLFKSYEDNINAIRSFSSVKKNDYNAYIREKQADVAQTALVYQQGNWMFDPRKIDPRFKEVQESTEYGLLGFLDPSKWGSSLSELGSSWSDVEHFAGLMATNAGLKKASAKLATFAMKRNPYMTAVTAAVDLLDTAKKSGNAVKIAEATEALNKARAALKSAEGISSTINTSFNIKNANNVLGASGTAAGLWFTREMRRNETASEAMDAYSTRILNEAYNNGIDLAKILNDSEPYLKNAMKIDTDRMTELDKLQLVLAYDIPTGDSKFEQLKHDARKGLNKVINDNNTLALMDYWETLPFMDYTGSFLKNVSKYLHTGKGLSNNILESQLFEAGQKTFQSLADSRVTRLASKVFKNPSRQLQIAHTVNFLKNKANKMIPLMTKEGIEEGQQQLLQTRFGRGEYDDYNRPISMFDIPSVFQDGKLGIESVLAYLGLLIGDPDNGDAELRKAMEIGAATGMWFNAGHVLTNALPQDIAERFGANSDNTRNLVQQLKNDAVIQQLIGITNGKVEDNQHVSTFYNAFKKAGITPERLEKSLTDLKYTQSDLVSQDFIDRDIKQMKKTYDVFSNIDNPELFKRLNITNNNAAQETFVQNAVSRIMDYEDQVDTTDRLEEELEYELSKFERDFNRGNHPHTAKKFNKMYSKYKDKLSKLIPEKIAELRGNGQLKLNEAVMNAATEAANKRLAEAKNEDGSYVYDATQEFPEDVYQTYYDEELNRITNDDDSISTILFGENKGILPQEDFTNLIFDMSKRNIRINALKKLKNELQRGVKFNDIIRSVVGTDTDTSTAKGILATVNLELALNAEHSIDKELLPDLKFDNLSKIEKLIQQHSFSKALQYEMGVFANAYQLNAKDIVYNNGSTFNPLSVSAFAKKLQNAISIPTWDELTEEQRTEFSNKVKEEREAKGKSFDPNKSAKKEYDKQRKQKTNEIQKLVNDVAAKVKKITDTKEGDQSVKDYDDLVSSVENVLDAVISRDLANSHKRKYIAHKDWEYQRPLVAEDISEASRGNIDAQQKVNDEIDKDNAEQSNAVPASESIQEHVDQDTEFAVNDIMGISDNTNEQALAESLNIIDDEEELKRKEKLINENINSVEDSLSINEEGESDSINEQQENDSVIDPEEKRVHNSVDQDINYIHESDSVNDVEEEGESVNEPKENAPSMDEPYRRTKTPIRFLTEGDTALTDYLYQTFFYDYTATNNMDLVIDGEKVNLPYQQMPGSELAKKLIQDGWFYSDDVKKYYIVTRAQKSLSKVEDLTIALVIQDEQEKKCYVAALRQPTQQTREKLWKINLDEQKYIDYIQSERERQYQYAHPQDPRPEEYFYKNNGTIANYKYDLRNWQRRAKDWFEQLDPSDNIKIGAIDVARQNSTLDSAKEKGKRPLMVKEIQENIDKLNQSRKEILDQYCVSVNKGEYVLPKSIRYDVVPSETFISNGKFDNQFDDFGFNVYNNMSNGKYGIATTVDGIDQQLQNGDLVLGYGRGEHPLDPEAQFAVTDLLNDQHQLIEGQETGKKTGRAGKIYWMVNTQNEESVPAMLTEERFNYQESHDGERAYIHENVELCIDPTTGEIISTAEHKPSAAEVLLYLITGRINKSVLPKQDLQTVEELVRLFVHSGAETSLSNDYQSQNAEPFMSDKQLFWKTDERKGSVLYIGDKDKNGGRFRHRFKAKDLFDPNDDSARRQVVDLIAHNMHWNTDVLDMTSSIEEVAPNLVSSLQKWFTETGKSEFKLAGLDQFSFKKNELFNVDDSGKIISPKETMLAAWMIKNGKLITTLSPNKFKDPFVFAGGVKSSTKASEKVAELKNNGGKKTEHTSSAVDATVNERFKEDKLANFYLRLGRVSQASKEAIVKNTDEARQEVLNYYADAEGPKAHGGMMDIIALDIKTAPKSSQEFVDSMKAAVQEYINFANKNRSKDKQISIDKIKFMNVIPQNVNAFRRGMVLPVLTIYQDGVGSVSLDQPSSLLKGNGVTGVFQSERGSGKFNKKQAEKWLSKILGPEILDNQILLPAIYDALTGKEKFGVVQVCLDVLGNPMASITLSERAGAGVEFHEAWHFINLLMHNEAQRRNLYKAYVEQHPELKSAKFSDIEEHMAEDFKKFMLLRTETGLKGLIKRAYYNMRDFVDLHQNSDILKIAFKEIQKGKYAKYSSLESALDPQSVSNFIEEYPEGINAQWKACGMKEGESEKYKGIQSAREFYQVGRALVAQLLTEYSINTMSDIRAINSDLYASFIETLRERNKNNVGEQQLKIQDILNNTKHFKRLINAVLAEYGLEPKWKTFFNDEKQATEGEQKRLAETPVGQDPTDPENIQYIDRMTLSKKDNVATRAKLFLGQIPKASKQLNPETGKREFVYETDDLFGGNIFWEFNKTWTKILKNLSDIESYSETGEDRRYKKSSLLGKLEHLAKTDAFFWALKEKIENHTTYFDEQGNEVEDVELQNQLYSTIKSMYTQVVIARIEDPKTKTKSASFITLEPATKTEKAVADRLRDFYMQDDNGLKAIKSLPKEWSQTLAISGLIEYDEKSGKNVVSGRFVDDIQTQLADLANDIKRISKQKSKRKQKYTEDEREMIADQVETGFISVLNQIGIPFDQDTMDFYIEQHFDENQTYTTNNKINALAEILSKGRGTIRYIFKTLENNIGNSEVTYGRSQSVKALDEMFTKQTDDSEISKMAIAYSEVNPSSSEFSVTGANGATIYPVNHNNTLGDMTRWLNVTMGSRAKELMKYPYARRSLMLNVANRFTTEDVPKSQQFVLEYFNGVKDFDRNEGGDYFEISPIEDYLAKMRMIFEGKLISPTMADKKTWYAIRNALIAQMLPKDLLTYDKKSADGSFNKMRFSNKTLDIFVNYLLDELESIEQYYDREYIQSLIDNSGAVKKNYHGKIKKGRLDFSGNAGKFRYFYDLNESSVIKAQKLLKKAKSKLKKLQSAETVDEKLIKTFQSGIKKLQNKVDNHTNLNQLLQYEYNRQIEIEAHPSQYGGLIDLHEKDADGNILPLDGFELVRKTLQKIRQLYFTTTESGAQVANTKLYDDLNAMLINRVMYTLQDLATQKSRRLVTKTEDGKYVAHAIPVQMLQFYSDKFYEAGRFVEEDESDGELTTYKVNPYSSYNTDDVADITLSAVGNHVLGSMISIIEFEKVFDGDPAYYSWKNIKDKNYAKKTVKRSYKFVDDHNKTVKKSFETEVDNLDEKHTDKTKRLGALLSPGTNLRTDYSEKVYKKFPWLRGKNYTVLNITDTMAISSVYDEAVQRFREGALVRWLRKKRPEQLLAIMDKTGKSAEHIFNDIYLGIDDMYNKLMNALKNVEYSKGVLLSEYIDQQAQNSANPYSNIDVDDAQVLIRPELYRKIRMELGKWTTEEDETGYSDEAAYQILEGKDTDGSWMNDPNKVALVAKFQAYTLKMSYFSHDSEVLANKFFHNLPLYNKMAIFPLFRFMSRTSANRKIYDRMNKSGHEIDMINTSQAVKVGVNQNMLNMYGENPTSLNDINELFEADSDTYINKHGHIKKRKSNGKPQLTVYTQRLDGLREQLNTEAHKDLERKLGTQIQKIAYSNILNNVKYGLNKRDRKSKTGLEIKQDIFATINAITLIGVDNIKNEFYKDGHVRAKAVEKRIRRIATSNGLGSAAEDVLSNGGIAASLMARKLFESSFIAAVNREVVDIPTKGGAAIQRSMIGFEGYDTLKDKTFKGLNKKLIEEYGNYPLFNGGKELKWINKDGSMEIMLSMNFFRQVLPQNMQDATFMERRQWLIDHDIIKGIKSNGKKSNPKPFGIGYRIPTQGMSSAMAIRVADVLPEQLGDTIVVPKEFTAQTGSDFDVDKIYLSTISYENGELEQITNQDEIDNAKTQWDKIQAYRKNTKGAVGNALLQNYIDVISDTRNFEQSRASIDTVTELIKKTLLPMIKEQHTEYRPGMYELLPTFQSDVKREYSTGKDGISPFALAITNLALTQATGLTMDFGDNEFKLGDLDQAEGQDGLYISDWLSAMINAHVDVAKDPYIFAMNVNQATYNMTTFLLRAGKGLSTFTLLAQPILREYADEVNDSGGVYGSNIDGKQKNQTKFKNQIYSDTMKRAQASMKRAYDKLSKEQKKELKHFKINDNEYDLRWLFGEEDDFVWEMAFNQDLAGYALENRNSAVGKAFQVFALRSFKKLEPYADELSALIKVSRVDNSKAGNSIAQMLNYANKIKLFKYGDHGVQWLLSKSKKAFKEEKDAKNLKKYQVRALESYFGDSYLDLKMEQSLNLVRHLLSRQLYTATPQFQSIFNAVMEQVAGSEKYDTNYKLSGDSMRFHTFSSKAFNDQVDIIATAIDDIMRFKVLTQLGSREYEKIGKPEDKKNAVGPIDFTCGGSITEVQNAFKRLMFGDPYSKTERNRRTLFENIAKFTADIQKPNPTEDILAQSEGLVDANGTLINEFLLYLSPQPKSEAFPTGRLLLRKPPQNIAADEKEILISSFYELLTHPHIEVRKLAREIAFYAYYSTYDQSNNQSFFDLVPAEFRKQYDNTLRKGLNSKRDRESIFDPEKNEDLESTLQSTGNNYVNDIFDLIMRNNWHNDDIVKPYKFDPEKNKRGNRELAFGSFLTENGNLQHGAYLLQRDDAYIKETTKGETVLYKKVGEIIKLNNETNKQSHGYNVYIAVPKLGVHKRGQHQFEFFQQPGKMTSIFTEQNSLPDIWQYDNIMSEIQKFVDEYNENGQSKYTLSYEKLSDLSVNKAMYFASVSSKEDPTVTIDGSLKFVPVTNKNHVTYCKKNSNTIFRVNTSEYGEENSHKVISINTNKSVESQIKHVLKKVKAEDTATAPLIIFIDGVPQGMTASDEEVKQYIREQSRKFKNRQRELDPDITKEDLKSRVNSYKEELQHTAADDVKQDKLEDFFTELLSGIAESGVNIGRVISRITGDNYQIGSAAADAASNVSQLMSMSQNLVIVDGHYDNNTKLLYQLVDQFDNKIGERPSVTEEAVEDEAKEELTSALESAVESMQNEAQQSANVLDNAIDASESMVDVEHAQDVSELFAGFEENDALISIVNQFAKFNSSTVFDGIDQRFDNYSSTLVDRLYANDLFSHREKDLADIVSKHNVPVRFGELAGNKLMTTITDPNGNSIVVINKTLMDQVSGKYFANSFLHEIIHALTVDAINNPKTAEEVKLRDANKKIYQMFDEMFPASRFSRDDYYSQFYALNNEKEFTAVFMTDPNARAFYYNAAKQKDQKSGKWMARFKNFVNAIVRFFVNKNLFNTSESELKLYENNLRRYIANKNKLQVSTDDLIKLQQYVDLYVDKSTLNTEALINRQNLFDADIKGLEQNATLAFAYDVKASEKAKNSAMLSPEKVEESIYTMCASISESLKKRLAAVRVSNLDDAVKSKTSQEIESWVQQFESQEVNKFDAIANFVSEVSPQLIQDSIRMKSIVESRQTISDTEYMYQRHDNFGVYKIIFGEIIQNLNRDSIKNALIDQIVAERPNANPVVQTITQLRDIVQKSYNVANDGVDYMKVILIQNVKRDLLDVAIKTGDVEMVQYLNELESIGYDSSAFIKTWGSADRAKDRALSALFHMVAEASEKSERASNKRAAKLMELQSKLNLDEHDTDLFELLDNGTTSGYLVRKLNYGKMFDDRKKFFAELNTKFGISDLDNTEAPDDPNLRKQWNKAYNDWCDQHVVRRYKREFYEALGNMSQETKRRRELIQLQIRKIKKKCLRSDGYYHFDDLTTEDFNTLQNLYAQKRNLASLYDINGDKKTDLDLQVAQEIKAFNDTVFNQSKLTKDKKAWQKARNQVIDECGGQTEYEKYLNGEENNFDIDKLNKWDYRNSKIGLKRTNDKIDLFEFINKQLPDLPVYEWNGDGGAEYEANRKLINELLAPSRDINTGDVNPSNLSKSKQVKIKALEDRNAEIKAAATRDNDQLRKLSKAKAKLLKKYARFEHTDLYKKMLDLAKQRNNTDPGYLAKFLARTGTVVFDPVLNDTVHRPYRWYQKLVVKSSYRNMFAEVEPGDGYINTDESNDMLDTRFEALSQQVGNEGQSMIPLESLYRNSAYDKIDNSPRLKALHTEIHNLIAETNARHKNRQYHDDYLLPQITGTLYKRMKNLSGTEKWSAFKQWASENIGYIATDDVDYGEIVSDAMQRVDDKFEYFNNGSNYQGSAVMTRPDMRELSMIPQYYTRKLKDPSQISSDICGITLEYWSQGLKYENKSDIQSTCEAIVDMLEDRTYENMVDENGDMVKPESLYQALKSGSVKRKKLHATGRDSNTFQMARKFLDMNLYNIRMDAKNSKVGKFNFNKFYSQYKKLTTAINLGLSPTVAIVGANAAMFAHQIQGMVGQRYDSRTAIKASNVVMGYLTKNGMGLNYIGNRTSHDKLMVTMEHYNISNQGTRKYQHSNRNRVQNAIVDNSTYGFLSGLDFFSKSQVAVTVLMSYRYVNGEFVTKEDIDNAGWNRSKDETKRLIQEWKSAESIWDLVNADSGSFTITKHQDAYNKVADIVHARIEKYSEAYDGMATEQQKAAITTQWYGNAILIHRQYLPLMLQDRFGYNLYDEDTQQFNGGQFRTAAGLIKRLILGTWQRQLPQVLKEYYDADGIKLFDTSEGLLHAILHPVSVEHKVHMNEEERKKAGVSDQDYLKEQIAALKGRQRKYHTRQLILECMFMFVASQLVKLAIRYADSDDDKKNNKLLQFFVLNLTRSYWEATTPYNFNEMFNNVKSPSAAIGTFDRAGAFISSGKDLILNRLGIPSGLLDTFGMYESDDEQKLYVQRGLYKDWLKANRDLFKLLPLHNLYEHAFDARTKRNYYVKQIMDWDI